MGTFGVKRASDEYFCPSTVYIFSVLLTNSTIVTVALQYPKSVAICTCSLQLPMWVLVLLRFLAIFHFSSSLIVPSPENN